MSVGVDRVCVREASPYGSKKLTKCSLRPFIVADMVYSNEARSQNKKSCTGYDNGNRRETRTRRIRPPSGKPSCARNAQNRSYSRSALASAISTSVVPRPVKSKTGAPARMSLGLRLGNL